MTDIPELVKAATKSHGSAYREGVRAERKRNLLEMKRIVEFQEYEARVALKDYIKHLERQE